MHPKFVGLAVGVAVGDGVHACVLQGVDCSCVNDGHAFPPNRRSRVTWRYAVRYLVPPPHVLEQPTEL
jgi:hypothetical protein